MKWAINWLRRLLGIEIETSAVLKPGGCECGHARCSHKKGKGKCCAAHPPDEESAEWSDCSCQIFILDDDDDDGDDPEPETPADPSVEELNKLMSRS